MSFGREELAEGARERRTRTSPFLKGKGDGTKGNDEPSSFFHELASLSLDLRITESHSSSYLSF